MASTSTTKTYFTKIIAKNYSFHHPHENKLENYTFLDNFLTI